MNSQKAPEEPDGSHKTLWTVVAIVVSIVSGGAMGAVITHYYTTRQTVVGYLVNTTSLGAGETTKSVLPTLKLQLDNVEIPVVYTHTLEFRHSGGPELDTASLSINLGGGKLLGKPIYSGPDPVHEISCKSDQTTQNLIICTIGRISAGNGPYKVILAADRPTDLTLAIDGKNARLEKSSPEQKESSALPEWFSIIAAAANLIAVGALLISRRRS